MFPYWRGSALRCLIEGRSHWDESLDWLTHRLVTMDRVLRLVVTGLP